MEPCKRINTALSIIVLCAIACYSNLQGLSRYEQKIISKHSLPQGAAYEAATRLFSSLEIMAGIDDRNLDTLKHAGFTLHDTWGNIILEHPALPGWVIKAGGRFANGSNNVWRILNAERIRRIVSRLNLNSIVVPQKYLFHIPGRSAEFNNNNYLVFAQKLNLSDKSVATLSDNAIHEACKVIRIVGICDAHTENIRRTTDGKVAFIDTEPFLEPQTWWWQVMEGVGVRRFRGATGAQIFRHAVARERRHIRIEEQKTQRAMAKTRIQTG